MRRDRPQPGVIVYVDWRDEHYPPEPSKERPGIIIGDLALLPMSLGVLTVIPLTGNERLAPSSLSIRIEPSLENELKKPSFALVWNIQAVAIRRVTEITSATITSAELDKIKRLLADCFEL